jgi:hypothetical protein
MAILARMAHEVTGKLRQIFDMQQVTDKFSKRELVLELGANTRSSCCFS